MALKTSSLTLEQKIGQMFLFGFQGRTMSGEFLNLLHQNHAGNIILFARNFEDARQLRALCTNIYKEFALPPLIAIDQEGGVVTRITRGATLLPGNMAIAAASEPALARRYGEITGRELRALGVNLNLAPVLDINHPENPGIGVRSFGDSPQIVAEYGREIILGMKSQYIFTTGKHFPGIGAALLDTHFDMPVIDKSMEELETTDIQPFRTAVEAGVDCIMTSHAGFPAFTPERTPTPATFTKEIITTYLRKTLGFSGVVITDDLEMGAAVKSTGFKKSITAAVKAGADMLCVCHDTKRQKLAVQTLATAVRKGEIPVQRINESVERILSLKQQFMNIYDRFFSEDIDDLVALHAGPANEITRKSITLFDPAGAIPLRLQPHEKLLVIIPRFHENEELRLPLSAGELEKIIVETVRQFHSNTQQEKYSQPPTQEEKTVLHEKASASGAVILYSYNAHLDPRQKSLVRMLAPIQKLTVLMMLRNPYDRFISPDIKTAVALYAPIKPTIEAGINRLFKG